VTLLVPSPQQSASSRNTSFHVHSALPARLRKNARFEEKVKGLSAAVD
jgi:hypothetical protein